MDRNAKLQELKDRQARWLRERQAEMDRGAVMAELGVGQQGPSGASTSYNSAASGTPSGPGSMPPAAASSSGRAAVGGGNMAGGMAGGGYMPPQQAGPRPGTVAAQYWTQVVRPEEVIDRLTERITDRLRSELRVEMQKESDNWGSQQAQLDTFLSKEMETQNTCPICYELMVPPTRAPCLLFPCGHTFCNACMTQHTEKNYKSHCPMCRKKIESRAPNYSLQQLILQCVARKDQLMGGAGAGGGGGARRGQRGGRGMRRQAERVAVRLRVLRNELGDTGAEEVVLDGRMAAATAVLGHLEEQEAAVLRRLAALQAELDLVREQVAGQQAKMGELAREVEGVRQRKAMLQATLAPLEAEAEKLSLLQAGLQELGR